MFIPKSFIMYFKMLHLFRRISYSIIYFHIARIHKNFQCYQKRVFLDFKNFTKYYCHPNQFNKSIAHKISYST
ncbi:hypothetical protein HanPI659440_Chr13g0521161 [Helianthus annuus]|nr:hypothetical protein HanPI659440_Chr13g0521161 [Helianthus annuus]